MNFNKKIQEMAVFIEFIASAGLAIFFHIVLHNQQAAYSVFGFGILLSLATYLLREDLEKTRHELVDQYHQSHELTFAMAKICDPECRLRAQELLAGTKRTIALLQQGYIPLVETEFYLEGAKCTDMAQHRLKTIDPITTGWLTRGVLVNSYHSNLRAVDRGVSITRIFIMTHDEMSNPDVQKILKTQYTDNIDVKVAFRDELPLTTGNITGRDTNSSCDFAIYDDHVATEVYSQAGTYFGRKTGQTAHIESYLRLFELIEQGAHTVAVEGGQIILNSEIMRLAA